ncbi:hypothetical protein CPAL_24430 [Clostridium thermopalmarium DSM 5974]|uniref:Uncharacterized protein n=2 Tax=Clostridium TaxID=1485 RepID=A0A151ARL2_9CLOT|nr:hypothetical protein CLCOL_01890 [Clostridium colicanis DSM 13634]PRR69359.1 hypothetical protein CPAL_24430 [Clostridium thermopalmarium DSM 5974]PVZ26375.1 hypothetical protein LX19_00874 [Clostridium thermopalmarium DSM 5974]
MLKNKFSSLFFKLLFLLIFIIIIEAIIIYIGYKASLDLLHLTIFLESLY